MNHMRSEAQIIAETIESTNNLVAPLELSGLDDWLAVWTYMLSLITQYRVILPLDVKEDFMRMIAGQVDRDVDLDDDEWDLENTRADYIKYLRIDPPVEDFCTVWRADNKSR